jgi:hypothetical protein
LKTQKQTLPGAHLVRGRLKNGRVLEHLFIVQGREVAGAYDWRNEDFDASELDELEVLDPQDLPAFEESRWVRFNFQA